jgi:hypothetical protein
MSTRPTITVTLDGPAVSLSAFQKHDGSGPSAHPTQVRVSATAEHLIVHFTCEDRDIWGTLTRDNDPLYQEEVVELFIAPGDEKPSTYYEFEANPLGTRFEAKIFNPTDDRSRMKADEAWRAAGLEVEVSVDEAKDRWTALFTVPWAALHSGPRPSEWRLNFYRIERPRQGGQAEFSCWSSPRTVKPNFHVPSAFGHLRLQEK